MKIYNFAESGMYKMRKTIEAENKEEAKQIYENWKRGDEFPEGFDFDEVYFFSLMGRMCGEEMEKWAWSKNYQN